jgi:tetratricopeptide (TPR) repeat protein
MQRLKDTWNMWVVLKTKSRDMTGIYRIRVAIYALIVLQGSLIYMNTLHNEFMGLWDDNAYILHNALIKKFDRASICAIFTNPYYTDYHPLQIFSYLLEYQVWGLNPFGYHLTNMLLHILNSALVYSFFNLLLKKHTDFRIEEIEIIAAVGAFLFLTHPANVESVAWISERKNVLSMTFFILAFYLYVVYKNEGSQSNFRLSLFTFLLALLSKASAVIFPLTIFVYDYVFISKDRRHRSMLFDKVPFLLLAVIFSVITVLAQSSSGAVYNHPNDKALYTFFTMLPILISYIKKSFFPFSLSPLYNTHISESILEPSVLISASLIFLLLAIILYLSYRFNILFFCVLFYFIPFLPVLHIVPIAVFIADRYLYIPLLGFSLGLSILLYKTIGRFIKTFRKKTMPHVYVLLSILIIYQFSVLTIKQGEIWQNGITLWSRIIRENPEYADGYLTLGVAYLKSGEYYDAYAITTHALQLGLDKKRQKEARYFRAMALILHGDYLRGERELERIRTIDPNYRMLFYGLGTLYSAQGKVDKAIEAWQMFLEKYKAPYNNYEDPLINDAQEMINKLSLPKPQVST